jgi:hypothetical protein
MRKPGSVTFPLMPKTIMQMSGFSTVRNQMPNQRDLDIKAPERRPNLLKEQITTRRRNHDSEGY